MSGASASRSPAIAVGGDAHAVALRLEASRQEVGDPCLVLDDQDLHPADASRTLEPPCLQVHALLRMVPSATGVV